MRQRFLSFATLAAFSLTILAAALHGTVPARASSAADAAATELPLIDLAGYKDVVAKYNGKPLLVTFWATWCQPCRNEYPLVVDLAKEYGPQGLVVVGVSLDEDADMGLVQQFLARYKPGFPNYREKPGIDADAFYLGVNPDWHGTMPETDFYGRDGHLARYFIGERNHDAFVQAIRLIMVSPGTQNQTDKRSSAGD